MDRRNRLASAAREFRGDHGDPHGLFLKQRNAEGSSKNFFQLVLVAKFRIWRRNFDWLQSLLPAQIGMHHIALDGPGPDNRNLNHQIIEFFRPQSRQHRHLRAAFHLENADGVRARQHSINFVLFFFENAGKAASLAVMIAR